MSIDFSVVDALKEDTFLGLLSKEDFNEFFSSLKKKTVNKGEVLIKEHQPQTEAFIVESGKIEKSHAGDISHIGPGSIVGLLHLVNKDSSFATLTAEQESVVLVINSDTFLSLLKNRDSFNKSYITFLSRQLRQNSNALRGIKSKLSPSGLNVAFFDTKSYMKEYFEKINKEGDYKFVIHWFKEKLNKETALLASGSQVVCCFVNDTIDAETIEKLNDEGIRMIALRCAGYDMIDLEAAKKHNMSITRVPAYSPYAVAEFAITLMMTLNRNIHKAFNRVREHNFSLNNLVGFDMHGKTVGLLGTGQIGACAANILLGFGCKVIAYDIKEDAEMKKKGVEYVTKENLYALSDIISIHLPLLKSTQHLLNADAFKQMKKGVILINTSRGGIVDSKALLDALGSGIVGGAGLDVYEEEKAYFFENKSDSNIQDEILTRLIASHNVIITSHQAFLTQEALTNIATSTLDSIKEFASGKEGNQLKNAVVQQYK